jgi:RNA polymerase sigma-70 factor, ECF subfamily
MARRRSAALAEPDIRDEEGLRAVYAAHAGELYRFALRRLGDSGAAQDAVQETFLRAWRHANQYNPVLASVRVWLFAIARNVVTDTGRRAATRQRRQDLSPPADLDDLAAGSSELDPDPSEALMTEWLVEQALRRLSDEHRRAIVETYLRGRPYGDVAAEQGIPVGTLRSRVFYALKALRVAMDEMGVEL